MPSLTTQSPACSAPRLLLATTVAVTARAFLLPIAQHFQRKGWRVDAIASGITRDDACRSTFDRVWEAEWSRNAVHPRNLLMARNLRSLVAREQYDLVHVHTPVAAFVTRIALQGLRASRSLQVIYTAHGFHFHPQGTALRNAGFALLERVAGRWTDFMVVMNREDFHAAQQKHLVAPERLRCMPGIGVDRAHFAPSVVPFARKQQLYAELRVSEDTALLLMVAEFTARKRHADALAAFARMKGGDTRLVLAGDGPLRPAMQQLAEALGIAERVQFLGQREDVRELMSVARALLLPSAQEGLPRSILEAMCMGLPTIGSRIRGTTELLEGGAGMLFDVGDVDGLARAMQVAVTDKNTTAAMGRTGAQQSERYDLAHVLTMHEDLYGEALAQAQHSNPTAWQNSFAHT